MNHQRINQYQRKITLLFVALLLTLLCIVGLANQIEAAPVLRLQEDGCQNETINFNSVLDSTQIATLNNDGTLTGVSTGLSHYGTPITMDIVAGPATSSSNVAASPGIVAIGTGGSGLPLIFSVPGAGVGGMKLDFTFSVALPIYADNEATQAGPLGVSAGVTEYVNVSAGSALTQTTTAGNIGVAGNNTMNVMMTAQRGGMFTAVTGSATASTFSYEYYVDGTRSVAFKEDLRIALNVCPDTLSVGMVSASQVESHSGLVPTAVVALFLTMLLLTWKFIPSSKNNI